MQTNNEVKTTAENVLAFSVRPCEDTDLVASLETTREWSFFNTSSSQGGKMSPNFVFSSKHRKLVFPQISIVVCKFPIEAFGLEQKVGDKNVAKSELNVRLKNAQETEGIVGVKVSCEFQTSLSSSLLHPNLRAEPLSQVCLNNTTPVLFVLPLVTLAETSRTSCDTQQEREPLDIALLTIREVSELFCSQRRTATKITATVPRNMCISVTGEFRHQKSGALEIQACTFELTVIRLS